MRLANGIIIDKEKTFGVLKFSALRREVHIQNEDGTVSEEIKERTYDLKCKEQGRMIQVSIPASVPLKEFDYNAEVEIINPVADTVAMILNKGTTDILLKEIQNHVWECFVNMDQINLFEDKFIVSNRKYTENGAVLRIVSTNQPALNAKKVEPSLEDLYLYYFREEGEN